MKKKQGKTGKSKIKVPEVEETNYEVFINNVAPLMKDDEMSMTIVQCYDAYMDGRTNDVEKITVEDIESQDMMPKEFTNPQR